MPITYELNWTLLHVFSLKGSSIPEESAKSTKESCQGNLMGTLRINRILSICGNKLPYTQYLVVRTQDLEQFFSFVCYSLLINKLYYILFPIFDTVYRVIFILCLVTFTLLHLEIVLPHLEFAKTKLTCLKRDILRLWNLHSIKIASSQQGRMGQK